MVTVAKKWLEISLNLLFNRFFLIKYGHTVIITTVIILISSIILYSKYYLYFIWIIQLNNFTVKQKIIFLIIIITRVWCLGIFYFFSQKAFRRLEIQCLVCTDYFYDFIYLFIFDFVQHNVIILLSYSLYLVLLCIVHPCTLFPIEKLAFSLY